MITARGNSKDGHPIVLVGLTGENCARMMADEPILINGEGLGLGPMKILIMGGRSEMEMAGRLAQLGVLTDRTIIHDDSLPT